MARLLAFALVGAVLLTVASGTSSPATRVTLYTSNRYKLVVKPTPLEPCVNLDTSYTSGDFLWTPFPNDPSYTICTYVWFFPESNCVGNPFGIKNPNYNAYPQRKTVTQITSFMMSGYSAVVTAKSFGCSFFPDPCVGFGCTDPIAVCNSTLGWSFPRSATEQVASQTLQCTCPAGYVYVDGVCTVDSSNGSN